MIDKTSKYSNSLSGSKNQLRHKNELKGFNSEKKQFKKKSDKLVVNPMPHHNHPYARFLRGNHPEHHEFKKFVMTFYKGLYYSINNLKGPSEEFIKKKSVTLPEYKEYSKQKFLMFDLDQTLIHSIFNSNPADVTIEHQGTQFRFNIRPYCFEFLEKMSQLYTIYIFTASTHDYATPIVEYLNHKKKTIHGILHRKNCMETNHGFYIKDLRIIKNRKLKDIVIVDNLIHSFGLQIENGIPILDFIDNKNDMELYGLENLLKQMHTSNDVTSFLTEKLSLRQAINHKEQEISEYFQKVHS